MRIIVILLCVAMLGGIWISVARSEPPEPDTPGSASMPEPITNPSPAVPLAGSEGHPKDPFAPYDPGPSTELWSYDAMTVAEKTVIDHGRTDDQSGVNAAYAAASQALSERARAEAAANTLGTDNLDTTGVVP